MTQKEMQAWHSLADEQGNLDRPSLERDLLIPGSIELDEDILVWTQNTKGYCKSVRQSPKLLETFVGLVNAEPEKVLEFARRWGVLAICEHGLPATHSYSPSLGFYNPHPACASPDFNHASIDRFCNPLGYSVYNDGGREPLSVWQRFSEQARSILNIAGRLNQDELGHESDWDVVHKHMIRRDRIGHSVKQQRLDVAAFVNEWLLLGSVRPALHWDWDVNNCTIRFEVGFGDFSGSTLFGALASQLMLAVSNTRLAFCKACQRYYAPPNRRAKRGQNNYCPDCGRKAALRDAQVSCRLKKKVKV